MNAGNLADIILVFVCLRICVVSTMLHVVCLCSPFAAFLHFLFTVCAYMHVCTCVYCVCVYMVLPLYLYVCDCALVLCSCVGAPV